MYDATKLHMHTSLAVSAFLFLEAAPYRGLMHTAVGHVRGSKVLAVTGRVHTVAVFAGVAAAVVVMVRGVAAGGGGVVMELFNWGGSGVIQGTGGRGSNICQRHSAR